MARGGDCLSRHLVGHLDWGCRQDGPSNEVHTFPCSRVGGKIVLILCGGPKGAFDVFRLIQRPHRPLKSFVSVFRAKFCSSPPPPPQVASFGPPCWFSPKYGHVRSQGCGGLSRSIIPLNGVKVKGESICVLREVAIRSRRRAVACRIVGVSLHFCPIHAALIFTPS